MIHTRHFFVVVAVFIAILMVTWLVFVWSNAEAEIVSQPPVPTVMTQSHTSYSVETIQEDNRLMQRAIFIEKIRNSFTTDKPQSITGQNASTSFTNF